MKTSIGRAIAGAAAYVLRSLGPARAMLVVGAAADPAPAPVPPDPPDRDGAVVRIEVNLRP